MELLLSVVFPLKDSEAKQEKDETSSPLIAENTNETLDG